MIAAPVFNTPNQENDLKVMKEYELTFNQIQSFKIKISLSEIKKQIHLSAIENNDFIQREYMTFLSLNELIEKNKQFKSFDTINEAFNLLIELFEKQKIKIKDYKAKENIKLEIKLLSLSGEEQLFYIDLYQREISKDFIFDQLISKIIYLENEINALKKENAKKDKDIEELKEMINEIKYNNKNIIINNNNNNKINTNLIINPKIDSKIIKKKNIDFVIEQLKYIYKINSNINSKNFRPKLLYRGSRDGFDPNTFHSKCDYINGTLTIVENDKNIIFGGFTKESWDGNYIKKNDEDAFCFSISLRKIYKVLEGKEAIRCDPKYGPVFLNDIFGFRNRDLERGEVYIKGACYYSGINKDFEINGYESKINVKEIEVFQVIFE